MRSDDQIMTEWDAIRRTIADGCTNSGPRDWIEGVIGEKDERSAKLEAAMRELIASGYERMGWHRTDKMVVDNAERVEDCRSALEAARAVLNKY